ncbi:MAG: DUF2997 domain-containing protein [Verrucomicrobiales bacterium]|jgi:hypothetical protein|nr:DUF2997 domain-containing protein [Verrucomicrobiales bacterium]
MKSKERIDVWISPEGAITIDAVGYTGSSCEEATRFLETSLGTVGRKQRSRDYYRKNTSQQSNQQEQQS